ncbi:Anosmin-1 [Bagarius yarrelli]|uniref:Anosmin-1 n=1 Tax=Bagarius yarrelli TaxID=175774 RepID=A0A556TKX3_BAGYA|nr:Anosmin-1 [Bagarius yarrelli]
MRMMGAAVTVRIILALICGVALGRKQDSSSVLSGIYRARCAARCLSLHSARIAHAPTHFQSNGSLGWCQGHKQCAKHEIGNANSPRHADPCSVMQEEYRSIQGDWIEDTGDEATKGEKKRKKDERQDCLEPCKESWEQGIGSCREPCERVFAKRHGECVTSCEFLRSVMVLKQGECPAPDRASGFAAACVESCEEDNECPGHKKCCANGCGHTCQPPRNLFRGAPLKPRKELVFQEMPSGALEVRWSSKFNVSAEPVLNVLQRRWNYGIHPSEDDATEWETSEERVWLADTRPGRWYQFRVAAVNVHGTRGYTTPSRHFRSSKDPSPPPAPSDIQVSHMTFASDRSVSVNVSWVSPADSDVPVHYYKLSWSLTHGEGGYSMPTKLKRRMTISGDSVSAELEGLREERSYTLELQSVSYWEQLPLKSSKAILFFSTQQAKKEPTASPVLQKGQSSILDVGTPFYQDGQLQVRVYWKKRDPNVSRYRVQWFPEFCSNNGSRLHEKLITQVASQFVLPHMKSQENFASLPGLQFSCKYKVVIQPVGSKSRAQAEITTFSTPPCSAIQEKSPKPITCPGDPVPPAKVQARAENLTAVFSVHDNNVTALFSWGVAVTRPPQQVTGYQVTWADVTAERRENNQANSLISQSQILPPERTVLVVSSLQLASLYRLEVGVITAGGQGPTTFRTFQTPGYARPVLHYSKNPI